MHEPATNFGRPAKNLLPAAHETERREWLPPPPTVPTPTDPTDPTDEELLATVDPDFVAKWAHGLDPKPRPSLHPELPQKEWPYVGVTDVYGGPNRDSAFLLFFCAVGCEFSRSTQVPCRKLPMSACPA